MHRRLRSSFDERRPSSPPQRKPAASKANLAQLGPEIAPRTTSLDPPHSPTLTHCSGSRHRDRVLGLTTEPTSVSKLLVRPNINDVLPLGHPFAAWDHKPHERPSEGWRDGARGKRSWGEPRVYKVGWEREVLDLEARLHETMRDVTGAHTFSRRTPTTVLDLGTGLGLWPVSQALVWPEATFVGLDIVPCQIDPALLAGIWTSVKDRVTWVQGDFLALPFDAGVFDMVHIRFVGLGLPESKWGDLLEEATRVLRSGGTLEIVEMAYTLPSLPFASLLLSDLVNPNPAMPIKFYLPIVGMLPVPIFEQTWDVAPGALGEAVMVWVRSALDYKGTGIGQRGSPVAGLAEVDKKWGRGMHREVRSATVVAWEVTRG